MPLIKLQLVHSKPLKQDKW